VNTKKGQRFAQRDANATAMQLASMKSLIHRMCLHIREMEDSRFWWLRNRWFAFKHRIGISRFGAQPPFELPPDLVGYFGADTEYGGWIAQNAARHSDIARLRAIAEILPHKPLISVVMPVYDPPEEYLRHAIESVRAQAYPYWELCIADDASTQPYVTAVLDEYASLDKRIKPVFRVENGHISRASNSALEAAEGDFVALLDHDDILTPDALFEIALLLNEHPGADVIYSDEDKVTADGTLLDPYFKPDWSPDTFLSKMYTCHLGVYRSSLVRGIGGFRPEFDGSQDYDLVLRLTERTSQIYHIPKVLYHWRISAASAASDPAKAKPYARDAALRAINDALVRRGEGGRAVLFPKSSNSYLIRYDIRETKKVSVIIPTRDQAATLNRCLVSVFEKTTYSDFEVVVVDNQSKEQETVELFDVWSKVQPSRFRVLSADFPFNYARLNNYAMSTVDGYYVLLLNNDTEVISPDWMTSMVEQAQRPAIGAVGALLLYQDDTIQHAGIVIQLGGVAGHVHRFAEYGSDGYFSALKTITNYSAVTGACIMMRRSVYEEVGGMEEEFVVAFNDVDLCLKIIKKGYRNIFLPHVVLYHSESKTRGLDDTPAKQARFLKECRLMQERWDVENRPDPFYNVNLTLSTEDFGIRS
jgi:O-antigen biosynthesis protein